MGLTAAACGSSTTSGSSAAAADASGPPRGTITFDNYPGWIGAHEVANFEKAYPRVHVKQVALASGGSSAQVTQIHENSSAYDMALLGQIGAPQLQLAGLVEKLDLAKIPNIKRIPQFFRKSFPWGVPTDYGKVGIGCRKDLLHTLPTSWKDLWEMAPRYSGKIIFTDYDVDAISIALLYLGHDINTTNAGQLNQAKQALIKLKPHIQAFLSNNVAHPLLNGSAVMAVDYDFDIAAASRKNPHIVWVAPSEGLPAYIEGWIAIKGTHHLPAVEALMNFALEPRNYGSFINATSAAYLMPSADRFIDKWILHEPSLKFDPAVNAKIKFEKFLPAAADELRNRIWEEVQAA